METHRIAQRIGLGAASVAVACSCAGRPVAQMVGDRSGVDRPVPSIQDVGGHTITDNSGSGAVKLSGITWAGGSTYYAVGGGSARLYRLTIDVDPDSGAIRSAAIAPSFVRLRDESADLLGGVDLEGVALAGQRIYVVNEDGPQISCFDLKTGHRLHHATTGTDPQLNVFSHIVHNRGWESVACAPADGVVWTANEEALSTDGPLATTTSGTVVRLQRFTADLQPRGQWAYVTDPISGRSGSRFDRAGVVDLVALEDGRLLVLERSTGKGFRIQLYLVDFEGATDVSAEPWHRGLRNQAFTPVSKTRLFVKQFTSRDQVNAYFVGMTLGPTLSDGSRSVMLIADNGGSLNFLVPNNQHALRALKITP